MSQFLFEQELVFPATAGHQDLLGRLSTMVESPLDDNATPVRFVITALGEDRYRCEIGTLAGAGRTPGASIFRFVRRRTDKLAVACVVEGGT